MDHTDKQVEKLTCNDNLLGRKIMENKRAAGILLHPSSLPSPHGIGDLGPSAYAFIDFLQQAGLGLWQVLPLGPTG